MQCLTLSLTQSPHVLCCLSVRSLHSLTSMSTSSSLDVVRLIALLCLALLHHHPLALPILANPSSLPPCPASSAPDLFVIPSSIHPTDLLPPLYPSIQEALSAVESSRLHCTPSAEGAVTLHLFPTTYYDESLHLHSAHSHLRIQPMSPVDQRRLSPPSSTPRHSRDPSARVVISGGIAVTNWTRADSRTWTAPTPPRVTGDVTQLFIDDVRIPRSRVPGNFSEFLHYAQPLTDPAVSRLGFQYEEGQFNYSKDSLTDAMVVVYHSWTTSHHYIDRLIPANRTVLFSNPSGQPIGTFGEQAARRFHIENVVEALTPNTFAFNSRTRTIHLMTDGSYDPNLSRIVAPTRESVMNLAGNDIDHPLHDVLINGIAISHSAWTIGRTQQTDSQATSWQTTPALFLANATGVLVTGVEVSHTGQYGVWIQEGTSGVNILDCVVTDTGAGGVRIGQMAWPIPRPTSGVNVIGNIISFGGNVFPDGVAVISHRASSVAITGNHIHHHRYSGISVGWSWGYNDPSGTSDVLIQGNWIHDIGQHLLNDQGGIYLLGIQRGTLVYSNVIARVSSYAVYAWGIYLDEGSSEVVVANNIVYETDWAALFQHYGGNNTIQNNVWARASLHGPPHPGDDPPDGLIHIGTAESHISWTFAHNVIYDSIPTANHSVFSSQVGVIAPANDNVFYNTKGAAMLFGAPSVSFAQWQRSGHEANSLIADPLFAGDVSQCDFFELRPDSPAAMRGFVNITRPAMWTPGCTGEEVDRNAERQFYTWRRPQRQ